MGQDITVEVNTGGKALNGLLSSMPVYSSIGTGPNRGLVIPTGGTPVRLQFDGRELMGLDIGFAQIVVADFLHLQGSLAFRKGEVYDVSIDTGGLAPLLQSIGQGTGATLGRYIDDVKVRKWELSSYEGEDSVGGQPLLRGCAFSDECVVEVGT